jgi:hypothetical protein
MPGSFSGNGSVEWWVEADNPRETPVSKPNPNGEHPKRYRQSGVDHWGTAAYDFTVAIKVPRDQAARRDLAGALRAAAERIEGAPANGGITISFSLPVEDKEHGGPTRDQILVSWGPQATAV